MTTPAIYDLNLHEETCEMGIDTLRVPGGWVYTTYTHDSNGNSMSATVFVPHHEEFRYSDNLEESQKIRRDVEEKLLLEQV